MAEGPVSMWCGKVKYCCEAVIMRKLTLEGSKGKLMHLMQVCEGLRMICLAKGFFFLVHEIVPVEEPRYTHGSEKKRTYAFPPF